MGDYSGGEDVLHLYYLWFVAVRATKLRLYSSTLRRSAVFRRLATAKQRLSPTTLSKRCALTDNTLTRSVSPHARTTLLAVNAYS